MLKSKKAHRTDFDDIEVTGIFPSNVDFVKMVRDTVEFVLAVRLTDFPQFSSNDLDLLSKLWSSTGANRFLKLVKTGNADFDDAKSKSMMRSLWMLLQQNEYVMMTFLQGRAHVPELRGTCGHFFATEFLPPGGALGSSLLEVAGIGEPVSWKERLRVSIMAFGGQTLKWVS